MQSSLFPKKLFQHVKLGEKILFHDRFTFVRKFKLQLLYHCYLYLLHLLNLLIKVGFFSKKFIVNVSLKNENRCSRNPGQLKFDLY